MHNTRPQSMPKKSSIHRLSLPSPQILTTSGTPSKSFYIANIFLNCRLALTSNLSPPCSFNYRSISHLSFMSKLIERMVKQRLTHHLSSNHLLNSFQPAYTADHSTESTLFLFTTTSSRPWLNIKSLLFFSLISRLPLIPLVTSFL